MTSPDVPGDVNFSGVAFSGSLGYRFSRNFALEAAYIDAGSMSKSEPGVTLGIHPRIEQLSAVGIYPLNDTCSVFVRAGADHWRSTISASVSGVGSGDVHGSSTNFVAGAGAAAFVDGALLRLEYQRMTTSQNVGVLPLDFRSQIVMLSVVWLFK